MRQTLKDRRIQLHRGMPMPRLTTLVLMMAILGLIFVRLRDPDTWRWFDRGPADETQVVGDDEPVVGKPPSKIQSTATVPAVAAASAAAPSTSKASIANEKPLDSGKASVPGSAVPAAEATVPVAKALAQAKDTAVPPEMIPTGPTDLDSVEQEDIQQVISAITDGKQEMTSLDMPAYYQILSWVDHQSSELLRKRAKKDVTYSDFRKTPDSMRLQIVELNLNVRQIIRYTNPPSKGITEAMTTREGSPIYEVRGFTREGGSNLYIGIVTDLPKGMPIGLSVNEDAKLVGYFFKLQGYISQAQQLEAEHSRKRPTPLQAPIIMGRLIWTPAPAENVAKPPAWLLLSIGSVATVVVVGWVVLTARRSRRRLPPTIVPGPSLDPDTPSVDNWLDQAQSGRLTFDAVPETARYDGAASDDGFSGQFPGNSFWQNSESNNGQRSANGHNDNGPSNNRHSADNGHGGSDPEVHDRGSPM